MTIAPPLLEVAANSVASALAAQEGGAGRIELCAALELGGLTPSYAEIATARDRLAIPLYVLVRPRAGDFLFNDFECEVMLRDIEACVALGCEGVVLGVLNAQGQVDQARCRALIGATGRLGVTFHRAFDMAVDQADALEAVIGLGCERVLSSGARASANEGSTQLRALVAQAAGRVVVMPGAGLHARNIVAIAQATGATEFHASARRPLPSGMRHRPAGLEDMATGEWRTDVAEVRAMVSALRELAAHETTPLP